MGAAVGQDAFVCFLRPQGVFVPLVERPFLLSLADNQEDLLTSDAL